MEVAVAIFEGIHLVIIVAVVGCSVVTVVRLAQIELSYVLTVEEHMHGLIVLCIDMESVADKYLLCDGIPYTTVSL